ncbi:MAG: hypothetical protein NTX50_28415 [Candidatus Sumerlaeota bacterium]|nr:hypothetical protein [Candidatus Sumerlaeota bacterium]
MTPKIIKSKAEYKAALARIDALISARPGTKEGEELKLWASLVETYEKRHFPIKSPDPVEAIHFRMEQLGAKQAEMTRSI